MEETNGQPEPGERKPTKGRSPSYPAISLEVAVRRAKELYHLENRHAAPVSAIAGHWGYSAASSGGRQTLAALKKFGLLIDEGAGEQRTGRLTELALEIVLNPEPSESLREAALQPRFHRQMWDQYGSDLPSKATLKYRLIREFAFTDRGAEEFIREYAETATYAGLSGDDPSDAEAKPEPVTTRQVSLQPDSTAHRPPQAPQVADRASETMTIPIPLPGSAPVYLSGEFPIPPASWDQMVRVLEVMRVGLVETPPERNLPPTASPDEGLGEAGGGLHE